MARLFVVGAASLAALIYAFIVTMDPWNVLPLSPPLPRVPISSNARYSFPALARSPAFDSAIFGTSTLRLLDPTTLDTAFAARFVNLSMNSATAWEQSRVMEVFAAAHRSPRAVIVGIDAAWCTPGDVPRVTPRGFPDWMYGGSAWRGYAEMFNLYALQEATNQAGVMLGLKRRIYGLDGFTNFLPDDRAYDPARVASLFAQWGLPDPAQASADETFAFATHRLLAERLAALPAGTIKLLVFPPAFVAQLGQDGSRVRARWKACKHAVDRLASSLPATVAIDFMIDGPITSAIDYFWDPIHYRVGVAQRMAAVMAAVTHGEAVDPTIARVSRPNR